MWYGYRRGLQWRMGEDGWANCVAYASNIQSRWENIPMHQEKVKRIVHIPNIVIIIIKPHLIWCGLHEIQ